MVLHARDLMVTELLAVDAAERVDRVVRLMTERHRGYVLVLRGSEPWGIATEWDFISKVLAPGRSAGAIPVAEIASTPLVTLDAETPTDELVAAMAAKGVRRIVVTSAGKVVGVVTSKEVVRAFQKYVDRISSDIARLQPSSV